MDAVKLNLARKWRSKTFDQVVGQQLSIRMLKNSLYLGQFFPVYLFSGTRGCGKTTTARIFASALNCDELPNFQKNPQHIGLPCLMCRSCSAMAEGKHPDFIEMDAASHTGVDSIRQLIDASSLLPIMGRKRVYLIDEAHMLSRASFNALLKLLEEPPASVLFILATTDPEKIIDTVRSRCFRLLFKPINGSSLLAHLQHICAEEKIRFDDEGLNLIIQETEGSARDALNIIEQVRFARGSISRDNVQQVLGHVDTSTIVELCEYMFCKEPHELLAFMHERKLEEYAADFVWHKCVAVIRGLLWLKYGVKPEQFKSQWQRMIKLAGQCSVKQLNQALKELYDSEHMFTRTSEQYALLEMLLLRVCQDISGFGSDGAPSSPVPALIDDSESVDASDDDDEELDEEYEEDEEEEEDDDEEAVSFKWKTFVREVETLEDPLLNSVFQQGIVDSFDQSTQLLTVSFAKDFVFFQDCLDQAVKQWRPLLEKTFGNTIVFQPLFTRESLPRKIVSTAHKKDVQSSAASPEKIAQPVAVAPQPKQTYAQRGRMNNQFVRNMPQQKKQSGLSVDISDATVWKKANLLISFFPGTVTELREGQQ